RFHVALKYFLDVRAADAAGCHLNQHLSVAHLRYRHFLHAHHALLPKHPRPHRLRYRPQRPHLFHHRPRPAHQTTLSSVSPSSNSGLSIWIKPSRNAASFSAAALLCRPNLISSGTFAGFLASSLRSGIGLTLPDDVKHFSKSTGRSSSLPSLMARITPTGICS